MAVRFSGARPMVANRFRICRRLNPASMRIRASSVSTYAQLPAEPLPKIVRRTGMADIRNKGKREQYFCHQQHGLNFKVRVEADRGCWHLGSVASREAWQGTKSRLPGRFQEGL